MRSASAAAYSAANSQAQSGLKFLFQSRLLIGGSRRVTGEARRSGFGGRLCKSKLGKIQMGGCRSRRQAKKERNEFKILLGSKEVYTLPVRCAG